ncbi:hypothetical protein Taro_029024 [Colocasia esculenta]|uniref:Uncharacterized protein n=1 Tax=Colocasia esculenta TaxID=4460 RepID=A0A843VK57_COLES|nr:hypothetical protein [Colocasia esculenta]
MEVNFGKIPFDLVFHHSSPILATGLHLLFEIHSHDESCRAALFINFGGVILTASVDCSILASDVETENPIIRLEDTHEDSVNRLSI